MTFLSAAENLHVVFCEDNTCLHVILEQWTAKLRAANDKLEQGGYHGSTYI